MLECRINYYGEVTPAKQYVIGVAFARARRREYSRVLRTLLDGAVAEVVFGTDEGERVIVTGGAEDTVVDTRDEHAMTVAMTEGELLGLIEAIEEHAEINPTTHPLDHPLEPGGAKFLCGISDLVFETLDRTAAREMGLR